LYVVALLAYALAKQPAAAAWLHLPAHLLLVQTFGSLDAAFYYNPAFWSLPPEVEFYLVLPLIARFGGIRALVLLLLVAVALREGLFLSLTGSATEPGWQAIATVHLPGLLSEFMLGALAYALSQRCDSQTLRLLLALGGTVLLAAVFATFANGGDAQDAPAYVRGNIGLMAAAGYALFVSALCAGGASLAGGWRTALTYAGHLSYGVYLFHNLAPALVSRALPEVGGWSLVILAFALTLTLSLAAHWSVERPLRAFGRGLSERLRRARS
jgi:peptidoglycan/LPS O-acetylase OafA/YrhL